MMKLWYRTNELMGEHEKHCIGGALGALAELAMARSCWIGTWRLAIWVESQASVDVDVGRPAGAC